MVVGVVGLLSPFALQPSAQEQAPNGARSRSRLATIGSHPARIEVAQDDLVKLTVQSEDDAYSLTIDEYRVSRRVPAGGSTTLEFRADRAGTFAFYSNLTNDARHAQMRGELVVRGSSRLRLGSRPRLCETRRRATFRSFDPRPCRGVSVEKKLDESRRSLLGEVGRRQAASSR